MSQMSGTELPGACYRKMQKSVLKKEKCFDFTIESSIDFKKGQILNKFKQMSRATEKRPNLSFFGLEKAKPGNPGYG